VSLYGVLFSKAISEALIEEAMSHRANQGREALALGQLLASPSRVNLANLSLAVWRNAMAEATMFEAKTQLSALVKRAQRGEKVVLTTGRKRTLVAMIVALKPVKERVFDLFHSPDFDIPADFDELPDAEQKAWSGEHE
jgi:antitoxin (DNA-binding transcriptional repressor) of toxin-antitoxin stability system